MRHAAPWISRPVDGMAVSDPSANQVGFPGRCAGLFGLWEDGTFVDSSFRFFWLLSFPFSDQKCVACNQDAPDDYESYSHKRCADDIKELATQLGAWKIIVCGHDWYVYIIQYFSLLLVIGLTATSQSKGRGTSLPGCPLAPRPGLPRHHRLRALLPSQQGLRPSRRACQYSHAELYLSASVQEWRAGEGDLDEG